MNCTEDRGDDPKIGISHVSDHFMHGSEGTHAISQSVESDGGSAIAYTDVSADGDVGESGFDDKK